MGVTVSDGIHFLVELVSEYQLLVYLRAVCATIVVYDHSITFGDEVNLVWKSPWSVVKAVFLMNRYYTFFGAVVVGYGGQYLDFGSNLSPKMSVASSHYYQLETWAVLGFAFAQIIFQIRIFALYGMNKPLCATVFSVFLCSMGLTAWIVIKSTRGLTATIVQLPGVNKMLCLPTAAPTLVKAIWIPTICFETLLCALALFRGYQTSDSRSHTNGSLLMTVLVRDSAIYYLFMASAHVASLIISIVSWEGYLAATVSFSLAMSCVLSSRVVLNIREITKIEDLNSGYSSAGNMWFNRTNSTGEISWRSGAREITP